MAKCLAWVNDECIAWEKDEETQKIIMKVKPTCPVGLREALIKDLATTTGFKAVFEPKPKTEEVNKNENEGKGRS